MYQTDTARRLQRPTRYGFRPSKRHELAQTRPVLLTLGCPESLVYRSRTDDVNRHAQIDHADEQTDRQAHGQTDGQAGTQADT